MKNKNTSLFSLLVSSLVIVCTILLVVFVLIPQIKAWLALRDEEAATRSRIAVLENNLTLLSQMDTNKLDDEYHLTTSALPADKDFSGMLNALTLSALKANVALDDYTFNVGDLASGSANLSEDSRPLTISVSVRGDMSSTNNFITEMQKRFPIANVVKVESSSEASSTDVEFYTKNLPTSVYSQDTYTTPLQPLSADEKVLSQLSQWKDDAQGLDNLFELTNSTQSATLTESPF